MRALALAVLLAGCTQLDFLPLGEARLPYWDGLPADTWSDGVHTARALRTETAFRLFTDLPMRCDGCADGDGDGLSDEWEAMVLERLRPVVALHEEEPLIQDPLAKVGAIGRVTPAEGGHIRVFIILGYSFDYGRCAQGGHRGDSERIALDLEIAAPAVGHEVGGDPALYAIDVSRFYTAAHEGTPTDASRISLPSEVEAIGDVTGDRWMIYAARAKHGSFPSRAACDTAADGTCTAEDCQSFHLLLFPIVNAGEPDAHLATETALGPIWSDEPFCGGVDKGDLPCASAPHGKLVDDPFAR